jgi:hypothetical protein
MLSAVASAICAALGGYFLVRMKTNSFFVVFGFLFGLAIFLTILFGAHVIFLGFVDKSNLQRETELIISFGQWFLVPIRWVGWILGLGVLMSVLGVWIGWRRG